MGNLTVDVSSLYLLAAPSTPPKVRETVIARAEAGEKISHAEVKREVEEARLPVKRQARGPQPKIVCMDEKPPTDAFLWAYIKGIFKLMADDRLAKEAELLIAGRHLRREDFRRIGFAFSAIGNTDQGRPDKSPVQSVADKYIKQPK